MRALYRRLQDRQTGECCGPGRFKGDMTKDSVTRTDRRALLALVLLCAIAWLPGFFTLPPLDRDESRFAQATKQMLETRDFVDINLGNGPRYEKPVGIYWLQAASTAVLGGGVRNRIWPYRVPSLLGALAAAGPRSGSPG